MNRNSIIGLFAVISILLSGCASWSRHGVMLQQPNKLRIVLLPVTFDVKVNKLKYIRNTNETKLKRSDEEELIRKESDRVAAEITGSIENELKNSYFFEVVSASDVKKALVDLGLQSSTTDLTVEQIKKLGKSVNAQSIMSVQLSGYGAIKKKWQLLLVVSGFVEGVVQGLIVEKVTENETLAVFVGGEEILSEVVTWVGGIYLFNHYFSPVILESKLISTYDGKEFWSHISFATIDRKALKKYPKDAQKLKELRLKVTYERAIRELIESLQKKAAGNISLSLNAEGQ
jgi:hypothetical protein